MTVNDYEVVRVLFTASHFLIGFRDSCQRSIESRFYGETDEGQRLSTLPSRRHPIWLNAQKFVIQGSSATKPNSRHSPESPQ